MVTQASPEDAESDASDGALLHRAREGDAGALDELVARHHAAAFRVARAIVRDEADAADAAQQGMVRALRGLEDADSVMLLAEWESLEAHLASRPEPAHARFREIVVPFTAGAKTTAHFLPI